MESLWTWDGRYFGYREEDNLWTYSGIHIGRFEGISVFYRDGRYLGALVGSRLIVKTLDRTLRSQPFAPQRERKRISALAAVLALPLDPGFEDFPPPEQFES